MKPIALVLALVFFVLGILYGMGILNVFASAGDHYHVKHMIALWVLALLCLIWARFQGAPASRH